MPGGLVALSVGLRVALFGVTGSNGVWSIVRDLGVGGGDKVGTIEGVSMFSGVSLSVGCGKVIVSGVGWVGVRVGI